MGDPRVTPVIEAASEAVRRYCRWHVSPMVEETVILDGTGGKVLQLPSQHVVEVLELRIGGVLVDPGQYSWSRVGLIELHSGAGGFLHNFPLMFGVVEVTMVHGFHTAPDLSAIASQVARFALASPMGRTREQAGQIAVSWGSSSGMAFSDSAREMMKPYRLQTMP